MNYVYIAASLDGYIAKADGDIDWLHEQPNPDHSDYGYADFMNGIDALVMGRHSYEKVRSFGVWPYEKMVFVLSTSLGEVPAGLAGRVEFLSGSPKKVLESVHARGFTNMYIDGGKVIQQFLADGLIDELIITRIPILLGSGIPLFGSLDQPMGLIHKATEVYNNALVKSRYVRG